MDPVDNFHYYKVSELVLWTLKKTDEKRVESADLYVDLSSNVTSQLD